MIEVGQSSPRIKKLVGGLFGWLLFRWTMARRDVGCHRKIGDQNAQFTKIDEQRNHTLQLSSSQQLLWLRSLSIPIIHLTLAL